MLVMTAVSGGCSGNRAENSPGSSAAGTGENAGTDLSGSGAASAENDAAGADAGAAISGSASAGTGDTINGSVAAGTGNEGNGAQGGTAGEDAGQTSENDLSGTGTESGPDSSNEENGPETVISLVLKDCSTFIGAGLEAEDFVESCEPAEGIVFEFVQEPIYTSAGSFEISVTATAPDGAQTCGSATLTVEEDTEPPVISIARGHTTYVGELISYMNGVVITDNCPQGLVTDCDDSMVDINTVGVYPVTYSAVDLAGNRTEAGARVTVKIRVSQPDGLYEKADEVLAGIIKDDKTELENLEAIFKWTKKHVSYINYSEQGDELAAAWEGLNLGVGDCYVYACVSKVLLTRAGYKNEMINTARHFWNLVDLGDGWYHYDTCPRKDKPYFFMWGDDELMAYSKAHGGSHQYDRNKWPDIHP